MGRVPVLHGKNGTRQSKKWDAPVCVPMAASRFEPKIILFSSLLYFEHTITIGPKLNLDYGSCSRSVIYEGRIRIFHYYILDSLFSGSNLQSYHRTTYWRSLIFHAICRGLRGIQYIKWLRQLIIMVVIQTSLIRQPTQSNSLIGHWNFIGFGLKGSGPSKLLKFCLKQMNFGIGQTVGLTPSPKCGPCHAS